MKFNGIIKELRLRNGYTQIDLSELSSLSLRTIQRIENNEVEPTPYSLNKIGEVLDVNLNEIKNNIMKEKSNSSNSLTTLLHLSSIFGVLITSLIWIIFKRDNEIVDYHGRDVINFKLNLLIVYLVFGITSLLLFKTWSLFLVCLIALYALGFVISIYNSIRVSNNVDYTYPIFLKFLKH